MSLAEFLNSKGYTEAEIDETLIRYQFGLEIPEQIIKDIREFNRIERDKL